MTTIEFDDYTGHCQVTAAEAETVGYVRREYICAAVRTVEFLLEHTTNTEVVRELISLPVAIAKHQQVQTDLNTLTESEYFDISALPCNAADLKTLHSEVTVSLEQRNL